MAAAYRRVYDSDHLQADCQESGSAPEPYARQSSMGYFFTFFDLQDRVAAFQLLATMYIKYIQIFRRLEQCYDQVVHPQKRRVLRHVLDGVMGRVLELKNEMVNLELCEYHYFDDVLSDLKLTPVWNNY